jgi:ferric-dicitrate binding protein FerR (iron transport regulator)
MCTRPKITGGNGTEQGWVLAENVAIPLSRGRLAKVVRVERGTVVVTQEGDLVDHVLQPGDELRLDVRGLAVAWAFTPAAISVREAWRSPSR